jgi:hypothetical protein
VPAGLDLAAEEAGFRVVLLHLGGEVAERILQRPGLQRGRAAIERDLELASQVRAAVGDAVVPADVVQLERGAVADLGIDELAEFGHVWPP